MAQKTNPNGLRLGLTQVWETTIQNYGKKSKVYSFFLIKKSLINKLTTSYFQLPGKKFIVYHDNILLNLKHLNKQIKLTDKFKRSLKSICSTKTTTKFFHVTEKYLTAEFLGLYSEYLFNKNSNLKRISSDMFMFLKKCLNLKKVIYSNNTIVTLNLIGFKIKISGRFDNSRNQMAKSYEQSFGSLSLLRLNNYVEFVNKVIFTKLGSCSFQIWLFYKVIRNDAS
uniref:Ribosomal protein S3 n=1 Tax=Pterocladiella luxurians TaxID=2909240 RepID=A0A1D8X7J3_9FLOR|nr:ribosomal protein S3 [Gelidium crinale f. luxurians]